MATPRGAFRLIILLLLAAAYFAISLWILLTNRADELKRQKFSKNAHRFCELVCQLLNIRVSVKNNPPSHTKGLIVGNHMGFIDIFALASIAPALFVTSKEMHETPVLGTITEFAGCVYVERRKSTNILKDLEDMVSYLRKGFRVVLYPEATSHNGEKILPFKKTLLMAAAQAEVPIFPCVFNFTAINNEPFSLKYRDSVCYHGKITFYVSLWRTLSLKSIDCEIEFLEPLIFSTEDNRAEVAKRLYNLISTRFRPVKPVNSEPSLTT